MARIYLKNGKHQDISNDEIVQKISSGEWYDVSPETQVSVYRPDGKLTKLPFQPKQIQAALKQNYTLASENDLAERDKKQSYGDDPVDEIKAGALGAARGITLGTSDYALDWANKNISKNVFPSKEDLRNYQDANPVSSTVGEIAGTVIPAIASGGTGAGVSLGRKLATGLSGAIERFTAQSIASSGGSLGAKIATRALEGQVYGALSAADTAFLRDKNIMNEVGAGALVGGLLGGAIPFVGEILNKPVKQGLGYVAAKISPSYRVKRDLLAKSAEELDSLLHKTPEEIQGMDPDALKEYYNHKISLSAEEIEFIKSKPAINEPWPGSLENKINLVSYPTRRTPHTSSWLSKSNVQRMDTNELQRAGFSEDEISKIQNKEWTPAIESKMASLDINKLKESAGFFGNVYARLASVLSGKSYQDLLMVMGRKKEGASVRYFADNADDFIDQLSRSAAQSETGFMRLAKKVFEHSRELKPQGMKHLIKNEYSEDVAFDTLNTLNGLRDKLDEMIQEGRGAYAGTETKIAHLRDIVNIQIGRLASSINKEDRHLVDAFAAAETVKRNLGKFTASLFRSVPELSSAAKGDAATTAFATARQFEDMYQILRLSLEKEESWGKLAARAQKDINKTWTSYIGTLRASTDAKIYRRWFPIRGETSKFDDEFICDHGDLAQLYHKSNSPNGELDYARFLKLQSERNELIQKHIKYYNLTNEQLWGKDTLKLQDIIDAFGSKHFGDLQKYRRFVRPTPGQTIQSLFETVLDQTCEAKDLKYLGEVWKDINAKPGDLLKPLGAGVGASLLGVPYVPAIGATIATKNLLQSPGSIIGGMRLKDQMVGLTKEVYKAVSPRLYNLIKKSKRYIDLSTATTGVPLAGKLSGNYNIQEEEDSIDIRQLVTNPGDAIAKVKELGSEYSDQASRLIELALSKAPKPKQTYLLDELKQNKSEIDPYELKQYKKDVLDIVLSPDKIVDLMNDNSLQPKHVEIFKQAYPQLYQGLVSQYKVWLQETTGNIPDNKLNQISILLQEPLTSKNIVLASKNQKIYNSPQENQSQSQNQLSGSKAKNLNKSIPVSYTQKLENL